MSHEKREKLVQELFDSGSFFGDRSTTEYVADFIFQDRKRILDEVESVVKGIIEEAHDGIKDDYCYVYEIKQVLFKISELKGEG